MSRYVDRQGRPITFEEWGRLLGDAKERRIADTTLSDGTWISTVWIGLNLSHGGRPLYFETMVFPTQDEMGDMDCERYSTETEALAGHEEMVAKWSARMGKKGAS